ncbi:MAG TPA: HK97 gp10 family phage protein [Anaerolineae bacterium]|nr:HK97 gp10 family phage protein [Anaerolineae bacterium]HOR00259.1 HK97 gp10 family phage protein [Anaerolineae bacterium]HPL30766.1 HK97 gp10 family phage protein [Anaerolineae bacterium]
MAKPLVVTRIVFDKLPELQGVLRQRASAAVRKAGHDIKAKAKETVPVDTGNLKNSIQAMMEGDLTAIVGTHVEYAPHVEYGTHKMTERPYLGPAAEAVRPSFVAAMRELLK